MATTAGPIRELALPKVNLTLEVLGRRADGYHELESLVAFAHGGIADEIVLTAAASNSSETRGPFASAIAGSNLVDRALDLLAETEPRLTLGHIELDKFIPIASGIGGGSADAAAVLRAVRRLNPTIADDVEWPSIARRLGADVPVCLRSIPVLMRGIGDRLAPIDSFPTLAAVLVTADTPMPADKTAQVFQRLGAAPVEPTAAMAGAVPAFTTVDDVIDFARRVGNDLARPALDIAPIIADVLGELGRCDHCQLAQMSGAGPTCYGLFVSKSAARAAADRLRTQRPNWWVTACQLK